MSEIHEATRVVEDEVRGGGGRENRQGKLSSDTQVYFDDTGDETVKMNTNIEI